MERWRPSPTYTKKEQFILKRLATKRKLFAFLRNHRHEIFDDAFQEELESMYRDTGAGKEPKPPALMAMALLLQGYTGLSDSDAVEATVLDLRWQLVLDTLGEDEPAFSQGALRGGMFAYESTSHWGRPRLGIIEGGATCGFASAPPQIRRQYRAWRLRMRRSPSILVWRGDSEFLQC